MNLRVARVVASRRWTPPDLPSFNGFVYREISRRAGFGKKRRRFGPLCNIFEGVRRALFTVIALDFEEVDHLAPD